MDNFAIYNTHFLLFRILSGNSKLASQFHLLLYKQNIMKGASPVKDNNRFYSSENFPDKPKRILSLREIKQSYSSLPQNPQNKLHASKTQIINKLSSQFVHKIKMDMHARDAIHQYQSQKIHRLQRIQHELESINEQNQRKLKQLDSIQKQVIKKLEIEIKRDKEIERKWIKQYESLVQESQKLRLTEKVKKIKQEEDWILIQKEQKRLQILARQFQHRQFEIARDKTHIPKPKKQDNKVAQEQDNLKANKSAKKQRKKKNASELKQEGRLFLQHAKKVQAQKLKESTKMLDVYKKSIDYLPEIKKIIKGNMQDLSKPFDQTKVVNKMRKKRNSPSKLSIL